MKKYLVTLLFAINYAASYTQSSPANYFKVYLDKDTVLTNSYSQKNLFIVADSIPIYKHAKIKVIFPKFFGEYAWDNMFWLLIPPNLRAGYMQVKSVNSGKRATINSVNLCADEFPLTSSNLFDYKFSHENNQRIVTIEMLDTLPKGDTLLLIYGANGSPTYTYNSGISQTDNFSVLVDNYNIGSFTALSNQPQLYFKYTAPKSINLSLASTGNIAKPILLKLSILDIGKNLARDFTGTIQLTCTDATAIYPSVVSLNQNDLGSKDVFISCNQKGIFTVTAKVLTSNFTVTGSYTSNPVNISNDTMHIYWGDFHTHTKFSRDAFGSDAYSYAKYGIGLDFYCGTDHADFNQIDTFGINSVEWNNLKQEAESVNESNRFISFLGYENSLDNPSGHYNFIYNFKDEQIQDVPMFPRHFDFTIQNLWSRLNLNNLQGKVLTIPHHTDNLHCIYWNQRIENGK